VHLEDAERAIRLAFGIALAAAVVACGVALIAGLGLAFGLGVAALALIAGVATGGFGVAVLWSPPVTSRKRGHASGQPTAAPAHLHQAP
jgi:hypothetical protein